MDFSKKMLTRQNMQSDKYKNSKIKDPKVKVAINALNANIRIDFYQKIYHLTRTPVKIWRTFEFLSNKDQIGAFIEKIEKEIKLIKGSRFDYIKYHAMIVRILDEKSNKLLNNKEIIKNAFIAKLMNIILLLKETIEDGGSSIKEVKNTNKGILR